MPSVYSGTYELNSGCVKGTSCSDGKYCGDPSYSGITFEQCEQHAKDNKAIAFAYRGTSSRWCRMCDLNDLGDIRSSSDWGVYTSTTVGNHFSIF